MSVWLTIPSKRPAAEVALVLATWKALGYRVALWRDDDEPVEADFSFIGCPPYAGYAQTVNTLIAAVIERDPQAEWFIAAGDDTFPDLYKSADQIAAECGMHFLDIAWPSEKSWDAPDATFEKAVASGAATEERWKLPRPDHMRTFGVMQPTGDRWQEGQGGFKNAPIDRVAGSAWIGREFAQRMYGGAGPLYREYTHMFVDEELQQVAEKMGVFWQRPDLTHLHQHWARGKGLHDLVDSSKMPEFLKEANSGEHWRKFKALFESRKAAGFPGHEPK